MSDAVDTKGILAHEPASGTESSAPKKRVGGIRWDEPSIEQQHAERGVLYGTQKIVEPNTPYRHDKTDEGMCSEPCAVLAGVAMLQVSPVTARLSCEPAAGQAMV